MAAVKQIKIGNTNYDLKALNAANQNQSNAVVRDVQYGTATPTGGSAGQIYLQYTNTDTTNPYVYAEDTPGTEVNVSDKYYSKTEVDNKFAWKKFGSHSGADNWDITSCWNQCQELYIVVSKYFRGSNTSANEVIELQCHVLKQQVEEDWTSSYNTGKIVFIPAGNRYNNNQGNSSIWNALFRLHNGNGNVYLQLNELFCVSLASTNQNGSGYYILYWR